MRRHLAENPRPCFLHEMPPEKHRRKMRDKLVHQRVAPVEHVRGGFGARHHVADDGQPVLLVGVEQFRRGAALPDQRELPAEVDHVLDAGVHPLPARRTVDVRRIATKENAAHAQGGHHPAVDPEARTPDQIVQPRGNVGVRVVERLYFRQRRLAGIAGMLFRVGDDEPEPARAQRKGRQEAVLRGEDREFVVGQIAIDVQVGQHIAFGQRLALERQARRVAHGAVRPLGADQVGGLDFFQRTLVVTQHRPHAARMPAGAGTDLQLREGDHLRAALDRHALPRELLAEHALGFRLREHQDKIVSALDLREVDPAQALAVAVDGRGDAPVAGLHHFVGKSALLEKFQGARVDGNRARRGGGYGQLVHDAHRDAQARKLHGGGHADRSRANDQDRPGFAHDRRISHRRVPGNPFRRFEFPAPLRGARPCLMDTGGVKSPAYSTVIVPCIPEA